MPPEKEPQNKFVEGQPLDKLTFQVGDKVVEIPKKELYTVEDLALALDNKNIQSVGSQVSQVRKKDTSITVERLPTGTRKGKFSYYTEKNLIKIAPLS
ncbi:MAG: hypothetical protein AAB600_03955 [Patescibacteria group bacterium]